MTKQVTKFETEDGSCFNTKKEALQHESQKAFETWYEDGHFIWGSGGQQMAEWLKNYKTEIIDFLQKIS